MPHECNLPARIDFSPSQAKWRFGEERTGEKLLILEFPADIEIAIATEKGTPVRPRASLDAWQVRDRFVNLKRSDDQLFDFLNDTGRWDQFLGPYLLKNMWDWQDAIKHLLLRPHRKWQDVISEHLNPYVGCMGIAAYLDVSFESDGDNLWFELTPHGCVGALLGSVLIDRVEGARFQICQRPDCRQVYRLKSRHKRKYCSYDCAHLQSVRASRKQQR
jgi:hypothetical protein